VGGILSMPRWSPSSTANRNEPRQSDWFTTLAITQAEFTQPLGAIFLTAAREQLK